MHTDVSKEQIIKIKPENLFLIIGIFIGVLLCVFIPFGTGFDEDQHLIRIYDLAHLNFLPNQGEDNDSLALSEFFTLSYRRSFFQNQAFDQFSKDIISITPNKRNIYHEKTRAVYSPFVYLPQAFLAGLFWIKNSFPVIPGTIFIRCLGLSVYLLVAYASIKIIPSGKWVLLVLTLAPMALYQASTVNADGITTGISFLFISYVLKIKLVNKGEMQKTHFVALVALTLLLGMLKPGAFVLVLLLVFILKKEYLSKNQRIIVVISGIVAVALNIFWWIISTSGISYTTMWDTDIQRNFSIILNNPADFLVHFFVGTWTSIIPYTLSWIAAYGYWVEKVPGVAYALWFLAILLSLFSEQLPVNLTLSNRFFLITSSLVSVLFIILLYNIVEYSPDQSIQRLGAQGRYITPFAPPVFIALTGLIQLRGKISRIVKAAIVACTAASLFFFSLGLYMTYYAECWEEILKPNQCTLPHYQNIDTSSPPYITVDQNNSLSQQIIPKCENVKSIDLLTGNVEYLEKEFINFTIENEDGNSMFSAMIPLKLISPYSRVTIETPQVQFTTNEIYILSFAVPMNPGYVEFATRPIDAYPGQLRINGTEVHSDVIFYYSCKK